MTNRLQLFEEGLQQCNDLLANHPNSVALLSISRQISYLIELESGANPDRSRLKEIIIGVLTAREIEPLDDKAAEVFYKIASVAKQMAA